MKKTITTPTLMLSLLLMTIAHTSAATGLLIPAYFDPGPQGGLWNQVAAAARQVPVIAIMNPNNGPGSGSDAGYVSAIGNVRRAGGKVIDYVSTRYGQRPAAEAIADINQYGHFYLVDGIFLDEMANDNTAAHLQYYRSLYQHIKSLNPLFMVVGNPGTATQEGYLSQPAADMLVTLESSPNDFATYTPPAWVTRYGASHFAYLAYGAQPSQLASLVQQAQRQNAGYLYVTDDQLPNPWDTLASFWPQEVSALASRRPSFPQPSTIPPMKTLPAGSGTQAPGKSAFRPITASRPAAPGKTRPGQQAACPTLASHKLTKRSGKTGTMRRPSGCKGSQAGARPT